ncbi:aminotransferase class V-fold PLP-dependent enzyme [Dactylosporangium sp. NPDC051484]|uniref:cysteine desulfurase family protein n=1 Tax=Dactylosporangium sp. NPDC051484 TaxID=3154942 RepID=UPI00344D7D6E
MTDLERNVTAGPPPHPGLAGGPIYLDYNATTPVDPRVADAMLPHLTELFGNPSSTHPYGDRPRTALRRARGQVATLVGARPAEIVFTGSGSEANLLAIRGAALAAGPARPHVITQATEHPAVLETCRALRRLHSIRVTVLPVDGVRLEPVVYGGGQERGLRAGTENVALAVALGAAADLAARDLADGAPARIAALRDDLHRRLDTGLPGRVHRNGSTDRCLPNTLNVSIDGARGHDLLAAVPRIAASTGSACHSGTHTPSPVLTAMGVHPERALGALRLSLGRWTSPDDITAAAVALIAAATT